MKPKAKKNQRHQQRPKPRPRRRESKSTAIVAKPAPVTAVVNGRERTLRKDEIELLHDRFAKDCSPQEFNLFMLVCKKKKLDPFTGQVYAIKYGGNDPKMVIIIGVNGFRAMAARSHKKDFGGTTAASFTYQDTKLMTPAGRRIPESATVEAFRRSGARGSATVYWEEFAPTDLSAKRSDFWNRMPKQMLGKCAEVHALKKVFPDLSDIYSEEEMSQRLQDLTPGGRQISSDGVAPSGSIVDRREQDRANQKLIAEAKAKGMWCEKHSCITSSCPSAEHTQDELETQWVAEKRAKEAVRQQPIDVKPIQSSGAQGAPATQSASRTRQSGPSSPAGTTVVRGVLHRVIAGTNKEKKVEYRDVQIGSTWYKCWHRSMFKPFEEFRTGGFITEIWIDKRSSVQGIVRIGPVLFEADGKTKKDFAREPGADG